MTESLQIEPGIEVLMERFEAMLNDRLVEIGDDAPTARMLRYHFGFGDAATRHGKRLRPRILLTVVQQESASDEAALRDGLLAGCAIEFLHNYSLIHDDIEDGDAVRHGRATVWSQFGLAHGINAGDMLCAMSYLTLLRASKISHPRTALQLAETLHDANYAMCIGQGMDIAFEARDAVAYAEYLEMIAGKTAALFGAACEMGAIVAHLPQARREAYAAYGRAYGRAFQIRDDILGTWGGVVTTGKPSGADIARRKWCFPVVWSLAQPPSAARDVVAEAYAGVAPLDDALVARVIAAMDTLGARAAADAAEEAALGEAAAIAASAGIDCEQGLERFFASSMRRLA